MAKTYLVTRTGAETITNKTINAPDNTITNIDAVNLKTQATDGSDAGKILAVKADTTGEGAGKWEITTPTQYKSVATLPATGDVKTVYFLNTAGANPVGLYVWNGTTYSPAAPSAAVDDATIVNDSGVLKVPTGDATKGIAVTNFKNGEVTKSDVTFPAASAASDSKLISEKVAATQLENKPSYATGSSDKTFTIGVESDGSVYYETA